MKTLSLAGVLAISLLSAPAFAQTRLNSVSGPGPTFAAPYNNPAFTNNGTYYPGVSPYANPYINPYANPYGNPYYRGYGGAAYGIPVVQPNGLFGFGNNLNMWRAASGYYYPWAGLPSGYQYSNVNILYGAQTSSTPQAQQPPITTMVKDMLAYLDEARAKKTLSEADYQHFRRRATDLQSKEDSMSIAGNGSLDPQDEQSIRNDVNALGKEITERSHRN